MCVCVGCCLPEGALLPNLHSVPLDYVNGGEMFTHLYQRQHFKEAEVRVYAGEVVLALEHLHKVGENLATCLLPWAWGLGLMRGLETRQAAAALSRGLLGAGRRWGPFPRPPGRKGSVLPPPLVSPRRGFFPHRELGAASSGHVHRTSSNGTSCVGSQSLVEMGLLAQAFRSRGP